MEALLNHIMDDDTIPNDLMDEECCMYDHEGTNASLSINTVYYD